jgi:hypothetical protein
MRNDADRTLRFVEETGMLVDGETVCRHARQHQTKPSHRLQD